MIVGHIDVVESLAAATARDSGGRPRSPWRWPRSPAAQRPSRTSMCDGMWTRCPSPGCKFRSRSAGASGLLGMRRSFDRVDVEMQRQRMMGRLGRAPLRAWRRPPPSPAAAGRPASTSPTAAGPSSIRRRGPRCRRRRMCLPDLPHRGGIRFIERLAILRLRIGIALGQGRRSAPARLGVALRGTLPGLGECFPSGLGSLGRNDRDC